MRGGHWMAATLIGALASAPALAQETRPAINVAVQTIVTSGALDVLREQSNVGARVVYSVVEPLIDAERQNTALPPRPGLATAWKRIDDRTVELPVRAPRWRCRWRQPARRQ